MPVEGICRKCPAGCTCGPEGCLGCAGDSNREVLFNSLEWLSLCSCKSPFIEYANECVCPKGCVCAYGTASCDMEQSHRFYDEQKNQYSCVEPYSEEDGECICRGNYIEVPTFEDQAKLTCLCKSRTTPTSFYYYDGECRRCPYNCSCNEYGCYKCDTRT